MSLEQFQAAIELGSILSCFLLGKSDLQELLTSKEVLLSSKRLLNSVVKKQSCPLPRHSGDRHRCRYLGTSTRSSRTVP